MKQALIAFVVLPLVLARDASAVETLSDSIVLFTSRKSGLPMVHGGGIVVGSDRRAVYIATVGHVATIDDLRVQFYAARGKEHVANVFPESDDADVDFAVVSVEMAADDPIRQSLRALSCRTEKLATNTPVTHIGHAASVWSSIVGNKVVRDQRNYVTFTNTGIAAASSGGAIFDETSRLVGLVAQVTSAQAMALKTDVIIDYLREWNVPMNMLDTSAKPPRPAAVAPLKPIANREPLFIERFEDNRNRWPVLKNTDNSARITAGTYRLGSLRFKYVATIPFVIDQDRDFEIRVTVAKIHAEATTLSGFGIVWGYRDEHGYFQFGVTSRGEWSVGTHVGGIIRDYVGEPNPIRKELPIRLSLQKIGPKFRYLINGQVVHQTDSAPFFGDAMGFFVWGNVEAAFDNLEVLHGNALTVKLKIAERLNCGEANFPLSYTLGDRTFEVFEREMEIDRVPMGDVAYSIEGKLLCHGRLCNVRGTGTITLNGNGTLFVDWEDRQACTIRLSAQ